jgi:hypothetical protein
MPTDARYAMLPKATFDKMSSVAELIRSRAPWRTTPDERGQLGAGRERH